ncbi:hypothetical protein AHAS_Ahas12G0070700 [Arachis hypogaea]
MAITLNSGFKMPIIGLADYKNEADVGVALKEAFTSGLVKREDLFITTKLWNSDHGHVIEACKGSLKKLQLDYLDLYLVHFPVATRLTGVGTTDSALGDDGVLDIDTTIFLETTWHAMEDLVRSIGISNYDIFLTRDCLAYSKIKPAGNQIETHPYFQRDSLVKFCKKHGVCVTAHTPLGGAAADTEWFGTVSCLDDQVLKGLAEKYKKTAAQSALRWGIQRNTVGIPKSSKLERLKKNIQVFDFELSKEDMELIGSMDKKYRTNQPARNPRILNTSQDSRDTSESARPLLKRKAVGRASYMQGQRNNFIFSGRWPRQIQFQLACWFQLICLFRSQIYPSLVV